MIRVVIACTAILLGSCVSTRVVSYTVPDIDPVKATSIVVMVQTPNLVTRADLEDELARSIAASGITAAPMVSIVNPVLRLTLDSSLTLASESYDMALVVVNDGSLRLAPGYFGTVSDEGLLAQADYEFDLIDLPSKKLLWVGSTTTESDEAFRIHSSMISKIVTRLIADGFLPYENFRIPSDAKPPYKGVPRKRGR
jgi:hypothetical protein